MLTRAYISLALCLCMAQSALADECIDDSLRMFEDYADRMPKEVGIVGQILLDFVPDLKSPVSWASKETGETFIERAKAVGVDVRECKILDDYINYKKLTVRAKCLSQMINKTYGTNLVAALDGNQKAKLGYASHIMCRLLRGD